MCPQDQNHAIDSDDSRDLEGFISDVLGSDRLRIEEDLGDGFVRLKSSEAERRQAIQDIRSSEDAVLELLRNSRDAGAKNIFLATHKDASNRILVVIDDGSGIPPHMHKEIFRPRVTTKLDSAKLDRWGIHGRGMALYSISVNTDSSQVVYSEKDAGTAIKVVSNTNELSEKTDQSTFPYFEIVDDTHAMRGPKNILRTAAEFAIEHRSDTNVYAGTDTEIIASMRAYALANVPAKKLVFNSSDDTLTIIERFGAASTPEDLTELARLTGMEISTRSARRILDGEIEPAQDLMTRIKNESFPEEQKTQKKKTSLTIDDAVKVKISNDDLDSFAHSIQNQIDVLCDKYYIKSDGMSLKLRNSKLVIEIDLVDGAQTNP